MNTAEQTFPGTRENIAKVRSWTREYLAACGVPPAAIEDALLILSELSTNALVHTRSGGPHGAFRVLLRRGTTTVRVEVTDAGGPGAPIARRSATDPLIGPATEEGGLGLALVEALATRWSVRGDTRSWTVTADVPCAPEHALGHRE